MLSDFEIGCQGAVINLLGTEACYDHVRKDPICQRAGQGTLVTENCFVCSLVEVIC